jgi:hypothetical protein
VWFSQKEMEAIETTTAMAILVVFRYKLFVVFYNNKLGHGV